MEGLDAQLDSQNIQVLQAQLQELEATAAVAAATAAPPGGAPPAPTVFSSASALNMAAAYTHLQARVQELEAAAAVATAAAAPPGGAPPAPTVFSSAPALNMAAAYINLQTQVQELEAAAPAATAPPRGAPPVPVALSFASAFAKTAPAHIDKPCKAGNEPLLARPINLFKGKNSLMVDADSKEQEQIIALTAQVKKLSRAKTKVKQPKVSLTTRPKDAKSTTKDFKGKHCHLECKYHPNRWVCHTSGECSKNPANAASASDSTPTSGSGGEKKTSKRLKAAKLATKLAAALLEDSDEESGVESDAT